MNVKLKPEYVTGISVNIPVVFEFDGKTFTSRVEGKILIENTKESDDFDDFTRKEEQKG
jgi:hypothetical protein